MPQGALSGQPTSSPMNVSALIVVGLYVVLLIAVRPFGSLEDMVQLRTHCTAALGTSRVSPSRTALRCPRSSACWFVCSERPLVPQVVVQTLNFVCLYSLGVSEYLNAYAHCPQQYRRPRAIHAAAHRNPTGLSDELVNGLSWLAIAYAVPSVGPAQRSFGRTTSGGVNAAAVR